MENDKTTSNEGLSDEQNSTAETIKSSARDILDKAKDSAGQAYEAVSEKTASKINEQKSNLSSNLSGVAESFKQVGQNLREGDEQNPLADYTAKYSDSAARQIERLAGYFERKDWQQILRDTEQFARREPLIFIGAAFAAGLLTARFLKSSNSGARSASQLKPKEKSEHSKNQDIGSLTLNQNAMSGI